MIHERHAAGECVNNSGGANLGMSGSSSRIRSLNNHIIEAIRNIRSYVDYAKLDSNDMVGMIGRVVRNRKFLALKDNPTSQPAAQRIIRLVVLNRLLYGTKSY